MTFVFVHYNGIFLEAVSFPAAELFIGFFFFFQENPLPQVHPREILMACRLFTLRSVICGLEVRRAAVFT